MDSDTNNYTQNNSGLLRFRSAPGSFFANFTDELLKTDVNTIETQGLLSSRFGSSDDNKVVVNGYVMNSQLPHQYPTQSSAMDVAYRSVSSMGMDSFQGQAKMGSGSGSGSNLMRQNSSPAGLFSHLTSQNDYATMRGSGNYRVRNNSSADLSLASSSLKGQINNYSSGLSMLSQISEVENENNATDDEKNENENEEGQFYSSEYPFGSWNNSSNFGENFSSLKRENIELRNRPPILSHHLSLPKSSAEMAAMEKLLQFQDTIPCKIRAKRGCATHPRSIAERVRRTKISERMRKLQELVPNMDKQTNTADMLDLAVEYIKDLQKQYKTLTNVRANCKCSASKKHVSK